MLKGTLDMMILRTLLLGDAHGHTIAKVIERSSEDVLEVEQGSLYPALHRLESRGWVSSFWGTSISHYHKGELLTVLLDLIIRRETHGRKSIQEVFRYLESAYETGSACFQGDAGLQQAIKSSTGVSALSFFEQYVRGTEHLPYDEFLNFVGLHVVSSEHGRRVNWTVTDLPDITSEQRAQRNAWLGMPSQ